MLCVQTWRKFKSGEHESDVRMVVTFGGAEVTREFAGMWSCFHRCVHCGISVSCTLMACASKCVMIE